MDLDNRTAVVTGGASGIGAATRRTLADAGADAVPATPGRMIDETLLGVADPEDVAATVAFRASDGASFVTGATIPVDGRDTAR